MQNGTSDLKNIACYLSNDTKISYFRENHINHPLSPADYIPEHAAAGVPLQMVPIPVIPFRFSSLTPSPI